MKKILLLLALLFSLNSFGQFIPKDKQLHFIAGATISTLTYSIVYESTGNRKKAVIYSIGLSTLAGLAKEIYDSTQPKNSFDAKDLGATMLGGISVTVAFELFNGGKK